MNSAPLLPNDKIEQILSFIETAEKLIYQEKMVDLRALQPHIEELCTLLKNVPKAEAVQYLDRLDTLFNALERLEKDVDLQHDALTEGLRFREGRVNPLMAQEIDDDDH